MAKQRTYWVHFKTNLFHSLHWFEFSAAWCLLPLKVGHDFIGCYKLSVCMCVWPVCEALLCDLVLLFAWKQIQTTCFSNNEFKTRIRESTLHSLPVLTPLLLSPLPACLPTTTLLCTSFSYIPLSYLWKHPHVSLSTSLCLFPHLSELISCSHAFILSQHGDRYSSACSGWWEIEFLLIVCDVTCWPVASVKHDKRRAQLGMNGNERNPNILETLNTSQGGVAGETPLEWRSKKKS